MKTKKKLKRVCFLLQVRKSKIKEYKYRHKHVWPKLLAVIRKSGWHNFSIFLRDDGLLIGYVETPNFKKALRDLGKHEINTKWQLEMTAYFEKGKRADKSMAPLEEVFHLD